MKKLLFSVITSSLVFLVILMFAEALLRLAGFRPWQYYEFDINEPVAHKFDPIIGWKMSDGRHIMPAYNSQGNDFQITITDNSRRITGTTDQNPSNGMVVVGGSYTLGWGISDYETYAWKLQKKYPSIKILNYGTDAYGTYQSLLVLERELPRLKSPQFVLYGFIEHHEDRNVAPSYWLKILSKYSRRSHIYVPYVTVDSDGMLIRHIPETYATFRFRESLALAAFIEDNYMRLKSKNRASQKRLATQKILIEMNNLSNLYGAKLIVIFLQAGSKTINDYLSFFQKHNIDNINCVYPINAEMRVPGDFHPNEKMHTLYAECISETISTMIKP